MEYSNYTYPLLEKVFSAYAANHKDVKNMYLVCCQHLLEPQLKMFIKFIEFGFDPNKIFSLGKIYSTNDEILLELQKMGIKAIQPAFENTSFDVEHKKNCEQLLQLIPDESSCVVLDDGGQLIQSSMEANIKVIFAIEQTSSGFRKLEHRDIPFPVINVARSPTKLTKESPLISKDIFDRILIYISKYRIVNPSICIIGLGPIGSSLLKDFKNAQFIVDGFDIALGHTDLLQLIKETKPNIIIGATGTSVLTKNDIDEIVNDQPIYIASASSSDREFPVSEFRHKELVRSDVIYKNITFLNNGFPLSFSTGKRNEINPKDIEKTICLLMGSVFYGLDRADMNNGFIDVPSQIENLIN